jgi:hypothetical protein
MRNVDPGRHTSLVEVGVENADGRDLVGGQLIQLGRFADRLRVGRVVYAESLLVVLATYECTQVTPSSAFVPTTDKQA